MSSDTFTEHQKLKEHSLFLEIGSFYNSLELTVEFYRFWIHSADLRQQNFLDYYAWMRV